MNAIFHHAVRKFSWKIYAINQVVRKTVFGLLDWPPKCSTIKLAFRNPQPLVDIPFKHPQNMKKTLFLFSFLVIISCNKNEHIQEKKNIENQFQTANRFLFTGNYEEFCNYNYPAVIEKYGGKEKVIEALKNTANEMKNNGYKITDIKYSSPKKFIVNGNELQTSFYYDMTIDTPNGKIIRRNGSVAISTDNGKNWKFIDTEGKSKEIVIENFPNLSEELIISQGGIKSAEK